MQQRSPQYWLLWVLHTLADSLQPGTLFSGYDSVRWGALEIENSKILSLFFPLGLKYL